MDNFSRPKIVFPNMTKFFPFYLDENGFYTNQKCFIITGERLWFLTAFLNSSLFRFCFKENFPGLQGGTRELSEVYFSKIPVIQVNEETNERFEKLIRQIQDKKRNGIPSKKEEEDINLLICQMYNLSPSDFDNIIKE